MNVVCLGDSLTYGYGVYPDENWCYIIKKHFNIDLVNKGVNGDTSAGMLFRSFSDIINISPSHAIIMGGTNDLLMGYSIDTIIDNMSSLLMEIKDKGIIPYLGIQPPTNEYLAKKFWDGTIDYSQVNNNISIYRNEMIKFTNKFNINYFDFYNEFINNIRNLNYLFMDGIHPSKKGHELMAKIIKF
ncbi:GDSL-type esterase/lipase family protein [Clostridium tetanomorphum]|uniref:Peptidase n=1 Tax=Clostridium tetanomorphum TaxID=1553 RepID=A0A923EAT4_CLOTT|nr:GDSL-type esterase/lipase family protein [Clostridium tetanomorphum]MBC2396948.1 peptidase [Clostridium tetanomorphum]NRZ97408.1 lysophospholipase L1-like esterase [Clostridium tetanomorphum]